MILVLILFLFLCFKFLYYNKTGYLKKNKKYKINKYKNKLFTKKLNLNFKFLLNENLNENELLKVDNMLLKLIYNVPKVVTQNEINNKPVFIHEYNEKLIKVAKKYIDFEDYNKNKISQEELIKLTNKNVNYHVKERIILPTKKLSFFGEFKSTNFDYQSYNLTIYKNKNLEIAHYDFIDYDYIKIIPYSKTDLTFLYYNPLEKFKNELMITNEKENYVSLISKDNLCYFGYSIKPSYTHYSKNLERYSKQNCILSCFNLKIDKSVDVQLYFSNKYENFKSLEELVEVSKNVEVFDLKHLLLR